MAVFQPPNTSSEKQVTTGNYAMAAALAEQEPLADGQVINLHIHLGHASAGQLWRTLKKAGRISDLEKIVVVTRINLRCKGR